METEKRQSDWMSRLHGASALCALIFAGLLVGSGIGLAMSYVPSQAEAFSSVLYLRQQGGMGAVLRSMHYHLSSGIVVAVFLILRAQNRKPAATLPAEASTAEAAA